MSACDVCDETIPISMVVHYLYCPRRAWLEAQGEHTDTHQVQAGLSAHRRVDDTRSRGAGETSSVDVCSRELGVSGRTDVLVRTAGGVRIREYKSTPVRMEAVVTTGMRVQLALQSLCLEEMGTHVEGTEIYFTDHNVVRDVTLDEADFDTARTSARAA